MHRGFHSKATTSDKRQARTVDSRTINSDSNAVSRTEATYLGVLIAGLISLLSIGTSHAGSATWVGQVGEDWSNTKNWMPQTVPNGPTDTATFGVSSHDVNIYTDIAVNGIVFDAGASGYELHVLAEYGAT